MRIQWHNVRARTFNPIYPCSVSPQAHHILSEIIQGGLVLETNVNEIDRAGESPPTNLRAATERWMYTLNALLGVCHT